MQSLRIDDRALPTHPAVRSLFPGGALRRGTYVSVRGSLQLALALIAETSRSGSWCGAIGLPELSYEAASALGIALDRFVLVPSPGPHELTVTNSLSEVLTAVVIHPTSRIAPSALHRLTAKLRDQGSALVVLGDWPNSESTLNVTGSRWSGLTAGHGTLTDQTLTVQSRDRRGTRTHTVRFFAGSLDGPHGVSADLPQWIEEAHRAPA